MIDEVRNTVLAIMNKNNFGYLTPADFNLYARLSQMDMFNDMFKKYNDTLTKEITKRSGSDLADGMSSLQIDIEKFIVHEQAMTYNSGKFIFPHGTEVHQIQEVMCYVSDSYVTSADRVTLSKAMALGRSTLTQPSKLFPIYYTINDNVYVMPSLYNASGGVKCSFIRRPKDPKWTYREMSSNYFVFDPSANDYQDFEMSMSDITDIVVRILMYAGVSIRDTEVYAFSKNEQIKTEQQ